ncbi:MAG: CHAT domain-containing protein [Cyanobacteria bacterium CRU_2_1]|nr:CHAT domain-containing protein [Cyanobacteria bacterium CRU_2_1]
MAKFRGYQRVHLICSRVLFKANNKRRTVKGWRLYVFLLAFSISLVAIRVPIGAGVRVASPADNHWTAIAQSVATPNSLEQGQLLYQAGRFSEAATVWQQVVQDFQAQGNRLNQALSLSYLSLAYQKLGAWEQAEQAISRSLALLAPQTELDKSGIVVLAQVLNTQASLRFAIGQPEAALDIWQQAENTYAQIDDEAGTIGSQINQAQALQALGLYRRAQNLLEAIAHQLQTQPDSELKALSLRSLGVVLQVTGDLRQSQNLLEQSLAISQRLDLPPDTSETLLDLGNTLRALQETEAALRLYQQVTEAAPTAIVQLNAQLNQLSLFIETQQWTEVQTLIAQIQPRFTDLAPSRSSIYAQVNFAASLMQISAEHGIENTPHSIASLLVTAIQQARDLHDQRAESYALGQLGGLYEQTQQWEDAQDLTQQALVLAHMSNASDIAYRWQWQLGRILKQKSDRSNADTQSTTRTEAIVAYTEAVKTLESIRRDLLATNPETQFSFREEVEPVYRELVELLVQPDASPAELQQAREAIEALQIAELENFFRSACVEPLQQIDFVDETAAILYPILLSDQFVVILSLPGQDLRHYTTRVSLEQVETLLENLRHNLILPYTSAEKDINPLAQQLYDWVIRSAETALNESGVKTLVFVLDGVLRNIPVAALYDGNQYLVEKYNIALTPGLRIFEPKPLAQIELRALTAGLTESRHAFAPLEFVELELTQIESEIPSEVLLNHEFTSTALASKMETALFPVVHIATHGQFSSQPGETFILAWDKPITFTQFDELLHVREQSPTNALELLVLSACETADGDKRAALGLAGVAVRAGARSTLASLWLVDDESTALLMSEFYRGLNTGLTKAEALRRAQQILLQGGYTHPRFWAAFVLLGNWL